MVSLVAMQFMLYAIGWLLSGLLLRDERRAVLCWAGFMACIGLGFLLTSQRGEPRTVDVVADHRIIEIGVPVDLHRTGDVADVVEQGVLVGFDDGQAG